MKYIRLTQGMVALVDDQDYERVNQWRWSFFKAGYAHGWAEGSLQRMHRYIMNAPKGTEIDHKNGNTLDNRRRNLRLCTHAENSRNRKAPSTNKSGIKGVSWDKFTGLWRVRIQVNGKHLCLGRFLDKKKAGQAYARAAKEHFGEFARLQ